MCNVSHSLFDLTSHRQPRSRAHHITDHTRGDSGIKHECGIIKLRRSTTMGEQQSSPATPPFCLVDIRNLRIDDTPPLVKYTSTSSYATGSLMNGRRAVLADLGESITEVPVQFFLVNILPPLRGGINIGNVVEKLQRRKIITRDGLCKSLPSRPALSPSFENATFKSLEEISKSICDAAQIRGTKKTIYFENNPNITPESKMRDSTSRPDGYFILHDRLNGVHWMDFALCAEYKKRNTPKNVDDVGVKFMYKVKIQNPFCTEC